MEIELTNGIYHLDSRGRATQPALIFLHYFGGSARTWLELTEGLADRFYCLALDLRGFGQSVSRSADFGISSYSDDLCELIEKLALTDYRLVGHSMGGKIALSLAARQPTGLSGLVLLAPSPPTPEPMEDTERQRLRTTHGQRAAALQTLGKITAHPLPPPLLERAVEDNLRSNKDAWQAWLQDGSRENLSDQMKEVTQPIQIIVGEADPVIPPSLIKRELLNRLSTTPRLEILPGVGHLSPLEAPDAVEWAITKGLVG